MSKNYTTYSWKRHPRVDRERRYQTCTSVPGAIGTVYREPTKTWVAEVCLPGSTERKFFYSEYAAKVFAEDILMDFDETKVKDTTPIPEPPAPESASELWNRAMEAARQRREVNADVSK